MSTLGKAEATIYLLENRDQEFHERKLDISGDFSTAEVADLDADGIVDLLVITSDSANWYAGNGDGSFSKVQVIADGNFSRRAITEDIDGDGDLDVLLNHVTTWNDQGTISEPARLVWYESDLADRNTRLVGDANEDGEVSFSDFLILSQNFGKAADVVWADGDFNSDGAVTFADLLVLSENFGRRAVLVVASD